MVVMEIGAGVVIASIRFAAEEHASKATCLIRVNPSEEECAKLQLSGYIRKDGCYLPLVAKSAVALKAIADGLGLHRGEGALAEEIYSR